jgi:glycosyltransferase involved in cell wall biosynthesis
VLASQSFSFSKDAGVVKMSSLESTDGLSNGYTTRHSPVSENSGRSIPESSSGWRAIALPPPPTVSLVIPARNEARNIAWVLEQIPDTVTEVILVDGNSTDVTLTTARSCRSDIRVVPQEGIGKGDALRAGFLAASGDIIVMIDADGSMSPREISHYLHFLENGYDFVKGSRFISGGGSVDISRFRGLGNKFLLKVFNSLYDARLTDLCYGFCAFHRRYLEHLKLSATGFEIEAEMVVHAMQAGLRIAEVPSFEMHRRTGNSNLRAVRDGTRVLRTVLRDHRGGMSGRLVQSIREYAHAGNRVSSTA